MSTKLFSLASAVLIGLFMPCLAGAQEVELVRDKTLLRPLNLDSSDLVDGTILWSGGKKTTARHADVDGDGDLDLVIGNDLYVANGDSAFALFANAAGLGATIVPVDDVLRAQLSIPDGQGAVVTKLVPNLPLAKAKLTADDIILQVGNSSVANSEDVKKAIEDAEGQDVEVVFLRKGSKQRTKLTKSSRWDTVVLRFEEEYRIGVSVSPTDRTIQSQLQLAENEGLIVTEVLEGTPARTAGIKQHDVLLNANGTTLKTVDDLQDQVSSVKASELTITLLRAGERKTIKVTPEKVEHTGLIRPLITDPNVSLIQDVDLTGSLELIQEVDLTGNLLIATSPEETKPETGVVQKLDQVLQELEQLRKNVKELRGQLSEQE